MLLRHSAAVITAALLLAGCGGGGGSPSAVPAPAASSSGANGASTTQKPVAIASLTVKYSAHFHTAKIKTKGTSKNRRPAYVNSGSNYLDVWVVNTSSSSAVHVVNSNGGPNVNPSADGSQTFSIPLYSTNPNQIVAYESDEPNGSYGDILSLGETDLGSFTAGSAPTIGLTMLMNAQQIGVMSDPDNGNNDAQTYSPYYSYNLICSTPATISPLYFFTTDSEGGFVDLAGAGGVSLPTVKGWTSDISSPANALTQGSGVSGAYIVTINNGNLSDGVTVNLSATNPAYSPALDAAYSNGAYPGLDYLYSNYGSYDYYLYEEVYTIFYNGQTFTNSIDILPDDGC